MGRSGQKFTGNLYIACGVSGAVQHLKGIKDAATIVAINKNPGAAIFKNCDYGIVGDVEEILPLLAAALDTGENQPAPPLVKTKPPPPPTPQPAVPRHLFRSLSPVHLTQLGAPAASAPPAPPRAPLPHLLV